MSFSCSSASQDQGQNFGPYHAPWNRSWNLYIPLTYSMCFISTAEICTDTERISCYNSSESGEDDQMVKDFPTQ